MEWKDFLQQFGGDESLRSSNISTESNACKDRTTFLKQFTHYHIDEKTIIIGDFNTSLNCIDRFNTIHVEGSATEALRKLMTHRNMCDIWRQRNPNKRTFSWKRITED